MKTKFIGIASMLALLAACEQDKYELDNLVPEEYNNTEPLKSLYTMLMRRVHILSLSISAVRTLWRSRLLATSIR